MRATVIFITSVSCAVLLFIAVKIGGPAAAAIYLLFVLGGMLTNRMRCASEGAKPTEWVKLHNRAPDPESYQGPIEPNRPAAEVRFARDPWPGEVRDNTRYEFARSAAEVLALKRLATPDPVFADHEPDHRNIVIGSLTEAARGIASEKAIVLQVFYRDKPVAVAIASERHGVWNIPVHYVKKSMRRNGIGAKLIRMVLAELDRRETDVVTLELPPYSSLSAYYREFDFKLADQHSKRWRYSRERIRAPRY
jgi:ribosomal protein S18 acetylase RimI-like enzyme